MSFNNLPDEIIINIWEFISGNNDMISIINTNKRFQDFGKKFGYIKSIKINSNTDFRSFIIFYQKRNDFLINITMENIKNSWIPSVWKKEMVFENCQLHYKIIDPIQAPTEILVIRDYQRLENLRSKRIRIITDNFFSENFRDFRYVTNRLKINWSKLKKLRILDIYASDIDLTGLDECKDLEVIRIDVLVPSILPEFIAKFPKLHTIAVNNLKAEVPLHFISDKLKYCFVPKMYNFTSQSSIVPTIHLQTGYDFINIQCLQILNLQ